jgi:myo-inositol-hexaphosphate 3-phosphohydrolase
MTRIDFLKKLRILLVGTILLLLFFLSFYSGVVLAQTVYNYKVSYAASGQSDADDMAIWVHPTDRSKSTVIVADKHNDLFVYDVSNGGTAIQRLTPPGSEPGNIDVRYNFPLNGQLVDIVAHNRREGSDQIVVYKVNSARTLTRVDNNTIQTGSTYGFCLYHSKINGKFYGFTTDKSGVTEQWELYDSGGGKVDGTKVRTFDVGGQTEGCVADDDNAVVYMAEENSALWKYNAEPNGGSTRTKVDDTSGHANADLEGVTIYHTGNGGGYIIQSSQGASEFDVYQRQFPHAYVTTFEVQGASGTDGIDVTSVGLGSTFPSGVFLAHSGGSAVRGVPWETIANGEGLVIDTSWDPRSGVVPTTSVTQTTTPTKTPTPTKSPTVSPTNTPTPTVPSGDCTPGYLPGDGNGDCKVDGIDYGIWFINYGTSGKSVSEGNYNEDSQGIVDGVDYGVWFIHYGDSISPETSTPTKTPTSTPTPTGPLPSVPPPQGKGIFISPDMVRGLSRTGAGWSAVKSAADRNITSPSLNERNSDNTATYAKALVYVNTGDVKYAQQVRQILDTVTNTSGGSDTLAMLRNVYAYVIAADLIDLKNYDPSFDSVFRSRLLKLRTLKYDSGCNTIVNCHEKRPNNWGVNAGASRIAIDLYLNDTNDLARAAAVHKGWLGDRSSYSGFDYGDTSWQCDSSAPVGINRKGCVKSGHSVDGVLPDDQRRGGSFKWPPPCENYVWGALQGVVSATEMLHRAGYPAWDWQDQAVRRALVWLHSANGSNWCTASGDDAWVPYLVNYNYGTNFPGQSGTEGKGLGFTDWTHQR